MSLWIKICGITLGADARLCADLGVDAIGLNFAAASPRSVTPIQAAEIVRAVSQGRDVVPEMIGVFVDAAAEEVIDTARRVGLNAVQLHGHETPQAYEHLKEALAGAGVDVYKAIRVATLQDVALASQFPGERILADAKVAGALGGTGQTFDWDLVKDLRRARKLILAGGLRPENVASAVRHARPFGVDTSSGVETRPGMKDPERLRAFVENARAAAL